MLTSMKILALGLERLGKSEEVEESHESIGLADSTSSFVLGCMRRYPSNTSIEKANDTIIHPRAIYLKVTNSLDGMAARALPGSSKNYNSLQANSGVLSRGQRTSSRRPGQQMTSRDF
jgi:hypothetical protein